LPDDPLSGAGLARYTSAMEANPLRLTRTAACLVFTALGACAALGPGPVVREQDRALGDANLSRVAVMPFASSLSDRAAGSASAANQVAVALGEALADAGVEVVAPGEIEAAVAARGESVPSANPDAAVRLAAELDATAVVIGRLTRFRDRVGSAAGATVSASVAFEVLVHDVASGRWLWTGRFDETQLSLSADVLRARRLPGGGTRWLTVQELAAWGAAETARLIASRRTDPAHPTDPAR
jgi:hypothetical protein